MTVRYTVGNRIVLQQVPDSVQPLIEGFLSAIPLIVGALVILVLGLIIGRILGGVVKRIVGRVRPTQYAEGTALEGGDVADRDLAGAFGDLTKYIVYLLTLLVVLDYVGIALPGDFLTGIAAGGVQLVIAVVILVAGIAIGRFVGRIVTSVVSGFGLDRYTRGTPLADATDSVGGIANAVGKLVEYLIYFFVALIALDYAGVALPGVFLTGLADGVVQVVVAAVILVVGFAVGRFLGDFVASLVGGFDVDGFVRGTPLADATDAVGGVGNAVGKIVEFLVYYFALVAAVDALDFPALSRPLSAFIGQIPLLIGGLVLLLVGIYVAHVLGNVVSNFDASRATDLVGLGVQVFVSYLVIVFALDTAGFDTTVLTNLFNAAIAAFFGALGLGLAIAIGIGVGWGSKDYVAENIDDWMGSARESAEDLAEEDSGASGTGSGRGGTDDSEMFDDDSDGPGGPSGTGGSSGAGPGPSND